jgi:hypothetical protein
MESQEILPAGFQGAASHTRKRFRSPLPRNLILAADALRRFQLRRAAP